MNRHSTMLPPPSLARICGSLALSLLCSGATAATAESAATAATTVALSTDAATSNVSSEAMAQALADRRNLEVVPAKLQSTESAYGEQLRETWLSLGNTLQTLGEYEEAAKAYGQALQAVRVMHGLHDLQQLPILEQQLATWQTLQNWEEVDAASHLAYYITTKSLPPGAAPRFDALLKLARWEVRAANEGLLPVARETDALAADLYRNEIRAIKDGAPSAARNTQLATLNLELASVEFQLTRKIDDAPLMAYQDNQQRSNSRLVCTTFRFPNGAISQTCTNEETPNMAYYFEADSKKDQALSQHFGNMQGAMMEALTLVNNEPADSPQRNELMQRMMKLTADYNDFMAKRQQSAFTERSR